MELFDSRAEFNQSLYKSNEVNRWKFLEDLGDNDVGFLIRSPMPVLTLTVVYITFVTIIGPFLMSFKSEPFKLKKLIRLHNLVSVFFAAYLLAKLYYAFGSFGSMFDCKKMFNFEDRSLTRIYQMSNLILIIRLSEYLDTIFFTLRKKYNQVTFLHVFHHSFVPVYAYWILRTAPHRFNLFIIVINSFVHVIMYFYYFLATFQERPENTTTSSNNNKSKQESLIMLVVNKLLLFKRYITQLQIMQFIILAIYSVSVVFRPNQCGVPNTYIMANLLLAFGFLGLFVHFYINIYKKSATGNSRTGKSNKRKD